MGWWASLRLSLLALAGLTAWLILGAALAASTVYGPVFADMDQTALWRWALAAAGAHILVASWVAGLFALAGVLLANLAWCTWRRLLPGGGWSNPRRLLGLAIHLFALGVIILQGASFMAGSGQVVLRLLPGQSAELPDGLEARLVAVNFASDSAMLNMDRRQSRHLMTRAGFDRNTNTAQVVFSRDGLELARHTLKFFHPAHQDGHGLFLVEFFSAPGDEDRVGAVLNLAQRPLWPPFALFYILLIVAVLAQTLREWRNGSSNGASGGVKP
jgi:hypothetical protein